MCGFLGEISHSLTSRAIFQDLLSLSKSRGPDQQHCWTNNTFCQMGFNRLSIIDLTENGKQPISSPSGRFTIVFNGEIYNYRELKKKYNVQENELRSTSDSEILAHLTDKMSIRELANVLIGMFAIAIYDHELRCITLIRDEAGIKPLFYGISKGCFVFASQFDQIFQHPSFKQVLDVNPEGLYDYLSLGYMACPSTVFKNIYQCQPGEMIEINDQLFIKHSWFIKRQPNSEGNLKEEEIETFMEFDFLMNKVVKDQLVSDVPLGVFLSGGIDSPLIAAYAKQHNNDITGYTIAVNDSKMDESAQATAYAKTMQMRHKIITFGEEEILKYNNQHFLSLTEPFGDYSSLPTYLITKKAKENNTVMLSGDGGDELFWGYPRFLNVVNHSAWFGYPKLMRKVGAKLIRKSGHKLSYAVSNHKSIEDWVLDQQCFNDKLTLFKLIPELHFSSCTNDLYKSPINLKSKESTLQWLRWNEFYGHLQRILIKVDRTSMHNSLEVRVPFLDQRIIDFAWKLKPGLGIHHNIPKYLLKIALQRKLNLEKISPLKRGFSVPIKNWLKKELKQDVMHHMFDIPLFGQEYWNRNELELKFKNFFDHDKGNEWGIWILYSLQKWAKQYNLV